jgi:hypothetical protein
MLLLRKVSSTLARSPGRLLLLGCLLIPTVTRAETLCTQIGPNTIQITEPGLVPGTPEPLNEINVCVLPAGFAAPALGAFFDLTDPNPADPLLPVSDYFDITNLGVVTLTSDLLDIGLPRRPLIATEIAEVVGSNGSDGATIVVAGVTYVVISDSPGGAAVPEPSSMLLVLTGVALLGVWKYRNGIASGSIPI